MDKKVNVRWAGNMSFIATDENKHALLMDTGENIGGNDSAFKPIDLLLAALGGCSGVDVLNILKKQKQDVREFNVDITGTQAENHPKYFTEINVVFVLRGKNIKKEFVERAMDLSHNKYCSVGQSLEPKVKINQAYRIEEVEE